MLLLLSIMTNLELVVRFAALFILGGYLLFRHRRRVLSHSERRNPVAWAGHGISTTELQKKLERVRSNHEMAKPRPIGSMYRRNLLRMAGQAVTRFGFFCRRSSDPLPQHGPERVT
jgi:hypothetical protein